MKISKSDSAFILRWAKKIKLINLLNGCCSVCGNSNVFQLEFHHLKNKEANISRMLADGANWDNLLNEVKKCEVICSNCHMEKHIVKDARCFKNKKVLLNNNLHCEKCSYVGKNISSLSFCHKDGEKVSFYISDFINRKIDINAKTLLNELNKCEVLCRNCYLEKSVNIKRFKKFEKQIFDRVKNYVSYKKIDNKLVTSMYEGGMKQSEIVRHFDCAKSSISYIVNKWKKEEAEIS